MSAVFAGCLFGCPLEMLRRRRPALPPAEEARGVRAMECNRDGAETCVVRAEAALREQDFAKALRLLIKAKGLYPLDNLDAKIRAVSAKVPVAAEDEELASTPVPPGVVGDALARKRAREEEGAEAGSKKPAAAASESPAGTDISAATTADAGAPAEPPPPEYDWQTSGHEWIGAFVARTFGKRTAVGRITKWVPPRADTNAPGPP